VILVDTSVWIGHLRAADASLVTLLEGGEVLRHPFVLGELAMGSLRQRDVVLKALNALPGATAATDEEVQQFVTRQWLFGLGIGWVDAHLLAATRLTPGARLWTLDKRLEARAGSNPAGHPPRHMKLPHMLRAFSI
jgi:hypothetical protein